MVRGVFFCAKPIENGEGWRVFLVLSTKWHRFDPENGDFLENSL